MKNENNFSINYEYEEDYLHELEDTQVNEFYEDEEYKRIADICEKINMNIYTEVEIKHDIKNYLNCNKFISHIKKKCIKNKTKDGSIEKLIFNYIRNDAEKGNAEAQYILGAMYYNGFLVKKSYENAVKFLENSAGQEFAEAMYFLSFMYFKGEGVEKNLDESFDWLLKATKKGHAESQCRLGCWYFENEEIEINTRIRKSIYWLRLASTTSDNVDAPYYLGLLLWLMGEYKKAFFWLMDSARGGNLNAQFVVAEIYRSIPSNIKSTDDYNQAFQWYKKAAEQGSACAQLKVGRLHAQDGDHDDAAIWYKKAAKQGNIEAQVSLAELYVEGNGVPENEKKYAKLLRRAAENGDTHSQILVMNMYREGDIFKRNLVMAYAISKILEMNKKYSDPSYSQKISSNDLERVMNYDEIRKGRYISENWHPKIKFSKLYKDFDASPTLDIKISKLI